jgi:Ca-activated chloride channel family protein
VAVDKTPARPRGQLLTRADVPLNLPAGWDFDKVFGEPVKTRHAEGQFKAVALAALPKGADQSNAAELMLPETATPAELLMLIGSLLAAMALALSVLARREVEA